MKNLNFSTYKYSKNKKTTYKLVFNNADTGDTQIDLPNTISLSNGCYVKSKSNIKPCYSLGGSKKHITSLYKFETSENDYFFGDIKKDKKKYLLIAKIFETGLDIYLFKNDNAIIEKYKSLEIVKNQNTIN